MFSYNLKTSVLALLVTLPIALTACGSTDEESYDPARDESFLALMSSADGKADGLYVEEGSSDARAVLQIVNDYTFDRLQADVGLDRRLVANLIAHRRDTDNAYDSLVELDATPWTTMDAFVRIWHHAHAVNLVGANSFCEQGLCYDVTTVELDMQGEITFDVGTDGWWARSHAGGSTVREARGITHAETVATSSFSDSDIRPWVVRRADGLLTAVTRVGREVVPEHGAALELGDLQTAVAAAYDADDELFVAAAAHDSSGVVQGLVIFRQVADRWVEEFKQPFDASTGTSMNARFIRNDGEPSLWVDVDHAARQYSRSGGQWRESMLLDMEESGFGDHPEDRVVTFHERDGVVFVHRATWNFSRRQEVVRVDGNMVTAVIDLPTAARTIAPHADHTFSIVYADGSLGHMRDEDREASTAPLGPATPDDIVRTQGDDIYVLQGSTLRILRAR